MSDAESCIKPLCLSYYFYVNQSKTGLVHWNYCPHFRIAPKNAVFGRLEALRLGSSHKMNVRDKDQNADYTSISFILCRIV